ncbi:DUF3426 domain-containing protein [Oxalobacteraceae bacterium CAVE-383]|nr:DUF3426 domain-containing protein [Oxalobacteraceae bacterium CAVE-383]
MALATQCPFCQTTFRVANDQLKLRDGLVRCGNCNEVFNGNAHLLPDQSAGNHNWPAAPLPIAPAASAITPAMARARAAAPNYGEPPATPLPDADAMAEIEAAWDMENRDLPPPAEDEAGRENEAAADALMIEAEETEEAPAAWRKPEPDDAGDFDAVLLPMHQSSPPRDEFDEGGDAGETARAEEYGNTDERENADADAGQQPEFILAAQRRQRRARLRRILMIVFSVILVFTAIAQGIYLERNRIALAAPRLKPLLAAACQPLRCTVGLPRQINQLSIESNELQAAAPDQPTLTLNLLLRNRADVALAWPDIELTLNDDDENALIRRVFAPADYLPPGQSVEAGMGSDTEQPVKLSFTLTQTVASGYRVYLFYP